MKLLASVAAAALALLIQDRPWNWADGVEWMDTSQFGDSRAICLAVRDREPPAGDKPPAGSVLDVEDCYSGALYYGLGRLADPERARWCAFLEAEDDERSGDWPFQGRAMLMTIYANGAGVPRDLDLAIRYACELDAAPAESHGRVLHLAEIRAGAVAGEFHYCDDITSGLRGGHCAAFSAAFEDVERTRQREALTASWSPDERAALRRLDEALGLLEQAVVNGEVDLTGTLRQALAVAAQKRLRDDLLLILRHLEAGQPLPYAASQLRREVDRFNAVYERTISEWRSEEHLRCCGAPTADGLREAQRAWMRYRDAFLHLAALRYPRIPPDALTAWLTAIRADTIGNPADTGL